MTTSITTSLPARALLVLALLAFAGCGGGGSDGGTTTILVVPVTSLNATGPGSLADAIASAPAGATIQLGSALAGTITPPATLSIAKNLRIQGPASGAVTISGGNTQRVFEILAGASVVIADLRIQNGASGSGAGIRNSGNLTLIRVVIDSCFGTSTARGGGIQNMGTATLTECTIQLCQGFNGAGFANDGGTMTMYRCLLQQNSTTGNVGGAGVNSEGTLRMQNCHVEGNFTTGTNRGGGAIWSGANTPSQATNLEIVHCTILGNTATGTGGALRLVAGGGLASNLTIRASIVAGNTDNGTAPDIDINNGTILQASLNLIGDGTGSGIVNGVNNNNVGTTAVPLNPMLGPLQTNGGPTLSRAPLAGSPALDSVAGVSCLDLDGQLLNVDQRGSARPVGPACDRGAIEAP